MANQIDEYMAEDKDGKFAFQMKETDTVRSALMAAVEKRYAEKVRIVFLSAHSNIMKYHIIMHRRGERETRVKLTVDLTTRRVIKGRKLERKTESVQ
jgi:hypothetical protein